MLILSRRCGEAIVVDERIKLTVLSIKGKQIRIGIEAPDDVSVHREEIYERIISGEAVDYTGGRSSSRSDKLSACHTDPLKGSNAADSNADHNVDSDGK